MTAADRNLLALAETTAEEKLASWMGMTVPALRRKLAALRPPAEAPPPPAPPPPVAVEHAAPAILPERRASPMPVERAAPARPPATHVIRGETTGEEIERLRAEVAWLRDRLREANAEDSAAVLMGACGLTPEEASLLAILWRRSPAVVRKAALFDLLFGDRLDGGPEPKILDVVVCKVRRKVEILAGCIETVWGVGYRLTPQGRARLDGILQADAA